MAGVLRLSSTHATRTAFLWIDPHENMISHGLLVSGTRTSFLSVGLKHSIDQISIRVVTYQSCNSRGTPTYRQPIKTVASISGVVNVYPNVAMPDGIEIIHLEILY